MKRFLTHGFAAFAFIFLLSNFSWSQEQSPSSRLITVNGEAQVNVVPDEVILNLGVETWDKDLAVAKNQNDEAVKTVLKLVKEFKIEDKYVQTDYIGIMPTYDDYRKSDKTHLTGYMVRKTIVITLKDISKFEEILQRTLESGVNYVHGIDFRTTELRKYRDQARSLAIKAAKEKANDLAKELGQKIGKPHNIQEYSNGWWSGYGSWWGQSWNSGMAQNVVQNSDHAGGQSSSDGEGTVALGQIKVKANVTVSFELE